MKSGQLAEIIEKHTGAFFLNAASSEHDILIPVSLEAHPEIEFDAVDVFWTRLFAENACFGPDGNLTEVSRQNLLSHLEAIQTSARGISLELLRGVNIIAAHIQENVPVE